MKVFWFIGLLSFSMITHAATSFNNCDRQLVNAGKACSNESQVEDCIMEHLSNTDCRLEIVSEENVDICEECK